MVAYGMEMKARFWIANTYSEETNVMLNIPKISLFAQYVNHSYILWMVFKFVSMIAYDMLMKMLVSAC